MTTINPIKRAVVTRKSNDRTFQVGEHIIFYDSGDICCVETQVFIVAEEAKQAVEGMEYEVDIAWVKERREHLLKELEMLDREMRR